MVKLLSMPAYEHSIDVMFLYPVLLRYYFKNYLHLSFSTLLYRCKPEVMQLKLTKLQFYKTSLEDRRINFWSLFLFHLMRVKPLQKYWINQKSMSFTLILIDSRQFVFIFNSHHNCSLMSYYIKHALHNSC